MKTSKSETVGVWAREPEIVDQCRSVVLTIDYTCDDHNCPGDAGVVCIYIYIYVHTYTGHLY